MAYYSCVALPQPPAPEWLFNYENVTFNGAETVILTDIDYDVATFGNKAWKFQFKWTVKDSRNGSSVALMAAGRNRYYGGDIYGYQTCFRNTSNNYIYFTNGNVNPGNDISIEYDGNGTINTYVNDVLNKTITNFDPDYLTGTPDSESKIFLGAWRNNQGNYSNIWNGTFEYIRMKFLD